MQALFTENDIVKLVKRYQDGPMGPRDKALILAAVLWGMKPVELSDLKVHHALEPSGRIRKMWRLPVEISFNGYERTVHTVNPTLVKALEQYLEWMAEHRFATGNNDEYLGIDPSAPLFVNNSYTGFGVTGRGNGRGTPTGMNSHLKELLKRSEFKGSGHTPGSFRRTWIIEHHRAGLNLRNLMEVSGIRSISTLKRVVNDDPENVRNKLKGLYSRL